MQATAYSLRLAMLGSGFPLRLMPGVRLQPTDGGEVMSYELPRVPNACVCFVIQIVKVYELSPETVSTPSRGEQPWQSICSKQPTPVRHGRRKSKTRRIGQRL